MSEAANNIYSVNEIPHERSSDFRQVYINNAGMAMSFYDVTIIFGQIMGSAGERPKIEELVGVTMSWEHLKQLHQAIGIAMVNFEAENKTKIRVPTGTPGPPASNPDSTR